MAEKSLGVVELEANNKLMNYVVFDIETSDIFSEVGSSDPRDLNISVVSVYEKNTDKILTFEQHEFDSMWPIFERADAIVGYNSEHFDIPLLNKYYHGDLTLLKSIDIMTALKINYGKRPKLDNVAAGTFGKRKISHGLQATEWWKQGRHDEVKKYCEEDVNLTRQLFEYALHNGYLLVKDKISDAITKVAIDTSDWTNLDKNAKMTKSLF